jgi:glycosyltransferase involved in cell wall biosynthesis
MRVLLINYEYPPVGAGAATAARAMARSLLAAGHVPTVLTTSFGELRGAREEDGLRVIRVASRRQRRESATISEMVSFMVHSTREVRRVVRSERIDGIIAFFSFPSGPAAWWAHRDSGVPYIVSLRGGDVPGAEPGLAIVHWGLAPVRRRVLRAALAVVANSPGLKAMSERADPVPVRMIPNGVDTEFFAPPGQPRQANPAPRLLFVGRFQAQKNLPWLLGQLAAFRRTSGPSFVVDLVGDGPQRPMLAARVEALQLADVVRFHGWTDRAGLRAHYLAADLVINPSTYEGMPNVVLEAMACGRPVLASRVPGNDTVVVDRVTGWLFSPDDAAGFADCLRTLLSRPDITLPLGVAARSRAESEYSWARATQSYLELLASAPPISTHA